MPEARANGLRARLSSLVLPALPLQCSSSPSSPTLPSHAARSPSLPCATRPLARSATFPAVARGTSPSRVTSPLIYSRAARPASPASPVSPSITSKTSRQTRRPSSSGAVKSPQKTKLSQLLQHKAEDVRTSALKSLYEKGPAAVAPHTTMLGRLLKDKNPNVLADAMDTLSLVGPRAAPYAADIAVLLEHECATVRVAAVDALSLMGSAAVPYVNKIAALLDDDERVVRGFALDALGEVREAAAPYMDSIAVFLTDANTSCRRAAVHTLGRIGEPAAQHAEAMALLLEDESGVVRRATIEALSSIGKGAAHYMSRIVGMLMDSETEVRWAACRALGDAAPSHFAAMARSLADPSYEKRVAAVKVLSDFRHHAKVHVVQVLQEGPIAARLGAIKTLCKMGEVLLLLRDGNKEIRRLTVETLIDLDIVANHTAGLADLLADDELSVRDIAIEALAQVGADACPYMVVHLTDANDKVRQSAVHVLAKIGEAASAHAAAVFELLWDPVRGIRWSAEWALGQMGEPGAECLRIFKAPLCVDTTCAKSFELPVLEMACEKLSWSSGFIEGSVGVHWVHGKENMVERLASLRGGDMLSHIPAMGSVTWKVPLAEALRSANANFWPRTWCVPENDPESLWTASPSEHFGQSVESVCAEAFASGPAIVIVKPSAGSQGKGIFLAGSSQEMRDGLENLSKPDAIIQEYIDRPLLLNGHKWDARIYALAVPRLRTEQGEEAFSCFIAHEGLARVCVDPYEPAVSRNLHRSTAHLTNYSLSKLSEKFVHNEDPADADHGTKRSLSAVFKRLEEDPTTGVSVKDIWQKLGVLVRDTINAISEPLQAAAFDANFWDGSEEVAALVRSKFPQCFQVLGFDVLLDGSGNAWLLEVNSAPSLDISEVIPRNDLPQSIAEINKVFCAATKGDEARGKGKLCRCAALPHPHTHQQSPVDIAVKLPVLEGALTIATRSRGDAFSNPKAWTEGTVFEYIP